MKKSKLYTFLNYLIALVWLINGLFCKVLNWAPRHQQIVGKILGEEYAQPFTLVIGFLEIGMVLWILSGIKSRENSIFQIFIVLVMNIIEVLVVPDLLLWGLLNLVFAISFVAIIYLKEFYLKSPYT